MEFAVAVAGRHGRQVGRRAKQQEDRWNEQLHRPNLAIPGAGVQLTTLHGSPGPER